MLQCSRRVSMKRLLASLHPVSSQKRFSHVRCLYRRTLNVELLIMPLEALRILPACSHTSPCNLEASVSVNTTRGKHNVIHTQLMAGDRGLLLAMTESALHCRRVEPFGDTTLHICGLFGATISAPSSLATDCKHERH